MRGFNLASQLLGIKVESSLVFGEKLVECGVEDTNDLGGFVIYNLVRFLIEQDWNGEPERTSQYSHRHLSENDMPSRISGFHLQVNVLDVFSSLDWIWASTREWIYVGKRPAVFTHTR
jgi:hypothetical protein